MTFRNTPTRRSSDDGAAAYLTNRLDQKIRTDSWFGAGLALVAGFLFYLSTKAAHGHFDYTYRIAQAFLIGHVGLPTHPGAWLNEMVPMGQWHYSVFPLGAVLVTIPTVLMQKMQWISFWPARQTAAVVAGGCVYFFYGLTFVREISRWRRVLLALFPIFGTWAWCNLGFAGAWQVALGFAMLGEAGCLYYTLVRPSPLLAGLWFAVAFGNRTELLVTGPVYVYLWLFPAGTDLIWRRLRGFRLRWSEVRRIMAWPQWTDVRRFISIPAILLLFTAAYNLERFESVMDFGYARIPGVLKEPWYQSGLFSVQAIRGNAFEMLFRGMGDIPTFPYLRPYAFGGSIFWASPFLFLLFREGGKHRLVCWATIGVLTLVLWMHGNPGGWQYSYRYAMIMLPWMFLLMVENGPRRLTATEGSLFVVSLLLSASAVYQFLWANSVH
jgi:hypothetical protein